MRAYVIGPVTGIPNDNRDAFEAAREQLEAACAFDEVRIPHDYIPAGTGWSDAMRISVRNLVDFDAVAVLVGSERSRGAKLERLIAREIGIECRTVSEWLAAAGGQPGASGKYYAITEVDSRSFSEVCLGFSRIADLIRAGSKVKFKAFASEDAARRYLETGCSYCAGHARGSFKASVKGIRVTNEKKK